MIKKRGIKLIGLIALLMAFIVYGFNISTVNAASGKAKYTGKVTDSNTNPLFGVSISFKKNNILYTTTTSDIDGKYTLELEYDSTGKITYSATYSKINYQTKNLSGVLKSRKAKIPVISLTPTNIPPLTPTNFTGSSSAGYINLTWTDVADNTGYTLERKEIGGFGTPTYSSSMIRTIYQNENSYKDGPLNDGTKFQYRLKAKNSYGDSGWAEITTPINVVVSSQPPVVNSPVITTIEQRNSSVYLAWTGTTGASYEIWKRTGSSGSYSKITTTPSPYTATSYSDSAVSANNTYYYYIKAIKGTTSKTGAERSITINTVLKQVSGSVKMASGEYIPLKDGEGMQVEFYEVNTKQVLTSSINNNQYNINLPSGLYAYSVKVTKQNNIGKIYSPNGVAEALDIITNSSSTISLPMINLTNNYTSPDYDSIYK